MSLAFDLSREKNGGEIISNKYLDGINPEFKNNFDNNLFNKKILCFSKIY